MRSVRNGETNPPPLRRQQANEVKQKPEVLFGKARTVAAALEMSERQFLDLVEAGIFPAPLKIGDLDRWDMEEICRIIRGEPDDGLNGIVW